MNISQGRISENTLQYLKTRKNDVIRFVILRKSYEELKGTINKIGNKMKHEVMIPVGESGLGFMEGKIVHTNEILVFLGDKYFVKVNSTHASGIIERRIKHLNESIEKIKKEMLEIYKKSGFRIDDEDVVHIMEKIEGNENEVEKKKKKINVVASKMEKKKPKVDVNDENADIDSILDMLEEEEINEAKEQVTKVDNNKGGKINNEETEGEEEDEEDEEEDNRKTANATNIFSSQERLKTEEKRLRESEFFKYFTKKTIAAPVTTTKTISSEKVKKKTEKTKKKVMTDGIVFNENPVTKVEETHENTANSEQPQQQPMSLFMKMRYNL